MDARLDFLVRVMQKEWAYLQDTDGRLLGNLRSGHTFVPTLVATAGRFVAEVKRIQQRQHGAKPAA